jgi:hypothetical protein
LIIVNCYAQSKKEQIELLTTSVDSLKSILEKERNLNIKKLQEQNLAIENLENVNESMKLEVKDCLNKLNKKELENTQLINDVNLNLTEISSLKMQLIKNKDSLNNIYNELNKLKPLTLKPQANITENNYDLLVTKFGNKEKDISEYNKWLANIVAMDLDGDTSYVTKNCLAYIIDVIDFYWGYDGSIDEKTLNKKWANQYDLKHSNFGHLFESGNGGWGTKKLTKIEFLGELNNGDWFKLTIKGGSGTNDFSTTLIRVIKVIKKGNAFYIDNFISLTLE